MTTISDDLWTLLNETSGEILRKIFLFAGFSGDKRLPEELRLRSRQSATTLKNGLRDLMVEQRLARVTSGPYAAHITDAGIELSHGTEEQPL